jgi:tRNA (guanine6-N2)-methyltransferase
MNRKDSRKSPKLFNKKPKQQSLLIDSEFLPGLEPFVQSELKMLGIHKTQAHTKESLRFEYQGDVKKLFTLRRAVAVYQVLTFPIPRPKALLGDEHLRRLIQALEAVRALHANNTFDGFRFSAAGSESAVFQRLAETLVGHLKLPYDKDGNLLLIIRPSVNGWEVAIRLTARPLSARPWRLCNLEGGLNATLAVVMNDLAKVQTGERYLNAMCGSGTLVIEQGLSQFKAARLVGIDLSQQALECTKQNLGASGVKAEVQLADATQLPFVANSFDVVTADPPWGDAVGTHEGNAKLYPAFLQEVARVTSASARLVLLTHELKLFEKLVPSSAWKVVAQQRVFHGGHYPNVYLLVKK